MTLEEEFEFWSDESQKIAEEAFTYWLFDVIRIEEELGKWLKWCKDCGTSFAISSPGTTKNVTESRQNGTTVYGLDIGMQAPIVVVVANITYEDQGGYSLEILDLHSIG